LRKFLGRGKGVAIRSYPALDAKYAKKIQEFKADYVFILDKPVVSQAFLEEVGGMQVPLVWIDHHDVPIGDFEKFKNFFLYNPSRNAGKEKSSEPVTYLSYKIANRKEDLWLAVAGCIADHYIPEFAGEFAERYPEFWAKGMKKPFDILYKTELGRIILAMNFGLKDSTTHIVQMQNFLLNCASPQDVFAELNENRNFRKRYEEVTKKYNDLIERAKENVSERMIFFVYSGTLSISADLANELSYLYPNRPIVVAFRNAGITNISMRGKNIKAVLERVLKKMEHATGGGHEDAVGARIRSDDLEKFKKALEDEIVGS
jgi:oligoribonuclease NrnB/cAMP/cGMP phosphodiesterase (DHH superfamily)